MVGKYDSRSSTRDITDFKVITYQPLSITEIMEKTGNYETDRLLQALYAQKDAELAAEKMRRVCTEILSLYGIEALQMFNQRLQS